jgi:hypothetical protein
MHGSLDCLSSGRQRCVVVFDRRSLAEHSSVVQQPVEPPELRADCGNQRVVFGRSGLLEIQRQQGRSRLLGRYYRVVDRFEPLYVAPVENDARPECRSRKRNRFADAIAGAGDENDAITKQVGGRGVGAGVEHVSER